jgi:hypothetical protein
MEGGAAAPRVVLPYRTGHSLDGPWGAQGCASCPALGREPTSIRPTRGLACASRRVPHLATGQRRLVAPGTAAGAVCRPSGAAAATGCGDVVRQVHWMFLQSLTTSQPGPAGGLARAWGCRARQSHRDGGGARASTHYHDGYAERQQNGEADQAHNDDWDVLAPNHIHRPSMRNS